MNPANSNSRMPERVGGRGRFPEEREGVNYQFRSQILEKNPRLKLHTAKAGGVRSNSRKPSAS